MSKTKPLRSNRSKRPTLRELFSHLLLRAMTAVVYLEVSRSFPGSHDLLRIVIYNKLFEAAHLHDGKKEVQMSDVPSTTANRLCQRYPLCLI